MRLGFWPPVYGNWIITDRPGVGDASFDYTKRGVLLGEQLGFDTLLVAEHFFNPLDSPHRSAQCLDDLQRAGRLDVAH